MKRLIPILAITFFLISCKQEKELTGLWYAAYSIIDHQPGPLYETTLLDFKGDQLYTIKIRDLSTGELDKVRIDTAVFEIIDSKLKFKAYSAGIQYHADSIVLSFEEPNQKLILRKIPPGLKKPEIQPECFTGSF